MKVLFATLMILVLWDIWEGKSSSITWEILEPPIVLGKDVVLYCNASVVENCCTNTATWMRDYDVIVHHGASINSSKYIQIQRSDGFLLVIKKFDEADTNHQYTCLYDFYSHSADLRIDKNNFKYSPKEDEMKANITRRPHNVIFADVMFEKVYPQPECILIANKEKIETNVTVEEETLTGLWYKMKLYLICEIHPNTCIVSVAVMCTVGDDKMVIHNENITDCQEVTLFGSEEKSLDQKLLLVFVFSCVTLCAAVIICVIIRRKMRCSSRTVRMEGGFKQPAYGFASLCRSRYDDIDEEMIPLISRSAETAYMEELLEFYGDSKTTKSNPDLPAQKTKNVSELISVGIETDKFYDKKKDVNILINAVRQRHQTEATIIIEQLTNYTAKKLTDIYKMLYNDILEYNITASISDMPNEGKSLSCWSGIYPASNGSKSTNKHTIPATNVTKFDKMIRHDISHDKHYIEKLAFDAGINKARLQIPVNDFNETSKEGLNDRVQFIVQAQKKRDVMKIVCLTTLYHTAYTHILVTNVKINIARQQRPIQSAERFPCKPLPQKKNASADVLKAALALPTWGMKKRSRIRSYTK